jgi:hypothetical protein
MWEVRSWRKQARCSMNLWMSKKICEFVEKNHDPVLDRHCLITSMLLLRSKSYLTNGTESCSINFYSFTILCMSLFIVNARCLSSWVDFHFCYVYFLRAAPLYYTSHFIPLELDNSTSHFKDLSFD